ncbi:hypothetical protein tpqmel_0397 [Candidatus Gastranaerophilus sp. (ex Termes propinquus)]|nr:hypothetical protein tpqmel_0397 [Candidatus Gastranaerophilus sp. (ex Termes propinquus)]
MLEFYFVQMLSFNYNTYLPNYAKEDKMQSRAGVAINTSTAPFCDVFCSSSNKTSFLGKNKKYIKKHKMTEIKLVDKLTGEKVRADVTKEKGKHVTYRVFVNGEIEGKMTGEISSAQKFYAPKEGATPPLFSCCDFK